MLLPDLFPTSTAFAEATGWKIEPHGACKGDLCLPLAPGTYREERVDAATVADRLGMAVVPAEGGGLWAIGPESFSGRALATVAAPDLKLQTFDGKAFALSSLRGTRMVLVAWAPY